MLLVPYSSTIDVMLERSPVRMDATATTVITPTTIPRTVSTLRNLFERMESIAIRIVSVGNAAGVFMRSVLGQRHDGIQARCFHCGINSSDHADAAGDQDREKNVTESNRHGNGRRNSNNPGNTGSQKQTQDSSYGSEKGGLNQELHQNLTFPRADRLTQADLKRPLGDRNQHDVHDDDAADHQRQERNGGNDESDSSGEAIDLAVERVGVHNTEVVIVLAFQLVTIPHGDTGFFDGDFQRFRIRRVAVELNVSLAAEHLSKGGDRDIDVVIDGVPKERAAFLLYPDNRYRHVPDFQRLAD